VSAFTAPVEERLARAKALLLSMECVAARGGDLPADVAEVCGWLRAMAHDELEKVQAVLGFDVMTRDC
jgi:hypothetical protein